MVFYKYQAAGNDYIIIDLFNKELTGISPGELSKKLCDRRMKIGADGLLILSNHETCDFKLKIFNSDGSPAEMCGNGLRSAVLYFYMNILRKIDFRVYTDSGEKICEILDYDGKNKALIKTSIGKPDFDALKSENEFPAKFNCELKGEFFCVSIGNPHAVVFVEDVFQTDLKLLQECVSSTGVFPNGVNVSAVKIVDRNLFSQRVYERGAGETLSCGTGAAAAYSVLRRINRIEKEAVAEQKGGRITISQDDDGVVFISGEAEEVFKGETGEI